jgi:imidazolonepropionase-like amidohydrolase
MKHMLTLLLTALAASCSAEAVNYDPIVGDPSATSIAIVGVNVVPMDREQVISNQTVLIDNGRITAIGSASSVQVPAGVFRIEGKGRYLLPGLIDMHVHIRSSELAQYVNNGVTSVRNMWGYEELPAIIRDVDAKTRKGPKIFSLTAGFDASPPNWPQTQISDDPSRIAPMIDHQYDLGFREIKVYQKLSRAAYDTIVAIAHRKGMTFAGHMPTQVGLTHVLESGQRSIEHLGGYTNGSQLQSQIAATVQAGTYNCPTLAILTMLNGASAGANLRSIVAALHRGGAKLLVGTDAGIDRTLPGSSIHDELAFFVQAGLSPYEALLGATRTAAEYLGQSASIGTIGVGKEADLILVRSNPLSDIFSTKRIDAVIMDGRLQN